MTRHSIRTTRSARRVLITAGPTHEYIDPVRYISNDSSGRMGFALAKAAARMGHRTTLVAGPVSLPTPTGVTRIDVISADDMYGATTKLARKSDIVIMAAAVADFSPEKTSKSKIKKSHGQSRLSLKLKKNPDILAALSKKRSRGQVIVGFALETEDLIENAAKKLREKGCDAIVANSVRAIGKANSEVTLLFKDLTSRKLPKSSKSKIAQTILRKILSI